MENKDPRKATDVLLELESKVDTALNILKANDLNMKLLSNKLNSLIEKMDKQAAMPILNSFPNKLPQFTAEAIQTAPTQFMPHSNQDNSVFVKSDDKIPLEENPQGFRRTSRPETYSGDNSYLPRLDKDAAKPVSPANRPPPGRGADSNVTQGAEVIVPAQAPKKPQPPPPPQLQESSVPQEQINKGAIPVEQRVTGKNGNSVFLADIDIVDNTTGKNVFKTRTSGAGKWSAPLPIGSYRVTISKRESITKQKVEVVQDIKVDGTQSPLVLQAIIIK